MSELLDFERYFAEIWSQLSKKKVLILASTDNQRVSARSMSVVYLNGKIYCQCSTNSIKFKQIQKNGNVGLCIGNISIDGKATLLGHSSLPQNQFFIERFKKDHLGSYNAYSLLQEETIIEIKPIEIRIWNYINGKPYYDIIKITEKIAERYPMPNLS